MDKNLIHSFYTLLSLKNETSLYFLCNKLEMGGFLPSVLFYERNSTLRRSSFYGVVRWLSLESQSNHHRMQL